MKLKHIFFIFALVIAVSSNSCCDDCGGTSHKYEDASKTTFVAPISFPGYTTVTVSLDWNFSKKEKNRTGVIEANGVFLDTITTFPYSRQFIFNEKGEYEFYVKAAKSDKKGNLYDFVVMTKDSFSVK